MSTRDLLVEIGTEELPPKSLPALSAAFTDGVVAALGAAGLKHAKVESFAAPRRLALLIRRLAPRQADQAVKRRGREATRVSAQDLLVEIGTEELPPRSLPVLSAAFTDGVVAALAAAGLKHGRAESFATPALMPV